MSRSPGRPRRKERRHERAIVQRKTGIGVILIALLSAMPAAAQTAPLSLTLEDAVRRAIDNNPELAIVRLETEVDTARIDQTRTAFTPVFSTMLGRSSAVTPPANFLLGERGVDVDDFFSSTGVRQRLQWGSGTWSVSWDTSRTATTNPLTSYDPDAAIGIRARVLAAVAPRSRRGFGTLSIRDCQAKPAAARTCAFERRSSRPWPR